MDNRTYCADLGNGTYLNPILFGDSSNPSVVKDGKDYYMVHAFQPIMWHSRDLLHWEPLYDFPYPMVGGAAELCKHGDTFYLYNIDPYVRDENDYKSSSIYVMTTTDISSAKWTAPAFVGPAFNINHDSELIDPGHIVDFEGKRWLFMSENYVFPLSDDGMHLTGPGKRVLEDEIFPDNWEIQGVYTEGSRLFKKNGWIYMIIAAGGTQGPPTGHGVFAYRAKKILGPWERSPYNPLIRTFSRHERWQNKGHGILVEAPDGASYIMYHAILKERENQGMMLMMEPVEWTTDEWFKISENSSPEKPLPSPKGGEVVLHGYPLEVKFPIVNSLPSQWLYSGDVKNRIENRPEGLVMQGSGTSLHDCPGVLCYTSIFENFETGVEITVSNGAGAGLALYYSAVHSAGAALKDGYVYLFNCDRPDITHRYNGAQYLWDHIFIKLIVKDQIVSSLISPTGDEWIKLPCSFNMEYVNFQAFIARSTSSSAYTSDTAVSAYSSLEFLGTTIYPALFTYGSGNALFHQFWIKEIKS